MPVQDQIDAINTRIGEVVTPNNITSVATLPTSSSVMLVDPAGTDGEIKKIPGALFAFLTDLSNYLKKTGETTQSVAGDIIASGNLKANSFLAPLLTLTENLTLSVQNSELIINADSNTVKLILPDVLSLPIGKKFTLIAYNDTNGITVETTDSQKIKQIHTDTDVSLILTLGQIYSFVNTGVYWQITNKL
jgi:hypothetical protein